MSTAERIIAEVAELGQDKQAEVLEFVAFIKRREGNKEVKEFSSLSLAGAMRGMDDAADLYSYNDIKERL